MWKYVVLSISVISGAIYFFDKIHPKIVYEEIGSVNNIIVYKKSRKLILFNNDKHIKTYTVSLGKVPLGKKEKERDQKTPEGTYYITELYNNEPMGTITLNSDGGFSNWQISNEILSSRETWILLLSVDNWKTMQAGKTGIKLLFLKHKQN